MSIPKIEASDIVDTSNLIWGCLDRVAREQGEEAASAAAIKNIHGNVAYLRQEIGDLAVIELLGELREVILARALRATSR